MRAHRPSRIPSTLLLAGALATGTGCSKEQPASAQVPAEAKPTTVTVLVTADENGHLLPHDANGIEKGGAAEMLGQWVTLERHCVPGSAGCTAPATLALSTGDHWGIGPSLSTHFTGEPVAEVMARMGYAASGFGNHELNFGRESFLANVQKSHMTFVGTNVEVGATSEALQMPAFQLVERAGMKVGVLALASTEAPQRMMAGRYEGITVKPYEESLAKTVPQAWSAGADALVLLADACPRELTELVAKHPEWKLSAVAGGACKEAFDARAGSVPMLSPGRRFEQYARVTLTFDATKPAGQRLTGVDAKVVDVAGNQHDPALAKTIAGWKERNDAELGVQIGFSKAALAPESQQLGQWVTRAWRESLGTDVAIINQKGLRAGLPAGKLTSADVHGVLPFENSLMIVELTGEQLLGELKNPAAIASGVTKAGKGFKDMSGKPVDAKKTYTVAVADYLYFGGDGFQFEKHDAEPTETGMMWQTPVIEWTKQKNTREALPLEATLRE